MITDIVVIPSPLALLPAYAGQLDPLPDVRAAAQAAVAAGCRADADIVLVAVTDREPRHTGSPAGERVGRAILTAAGLGAPAEVAVVEWDADAARSRAVGADIERSAPRPTSVVVVADGSARRSLKAPGHLDGRAEEFDARWLTALRAADAHALAAIDARLAAQLLAHGWAGWQVVARLLREGSWRCERCEHFDPFGVMYAVAHLRRESGPIPEGGHCAS